jgi:hypothetical protein
MRQPHPYERRLIKKLENQSKALAQQYTHCIEVAKNWRILSTQTSSEDAFSNTLLKNGCDPNFTQNITDKNLRQWAEICLNHYKE